MSERHPECPPNGCDICQSDWPCAKLEGERSAKQMTPPVSIGPRIEIETLMSQNEQLRAENKRHKVNCDALLEELHKEITAKVAIRDERDQLKSWQESMRVALHCIVNTPPKGFQTLRQDADWWIRLVNDMKSQAEGALAQSQPAPLSECMNCGGGGKVEAENPDEFATCHECNGTGSLAKLGGEPHAG